MLFGCAEPYIEYLTCMIFSCSRNNFLYFYNGNIDARYRL